MLKKVLSVAGRPGLYMLLNQGKNCLIVESLNDKGKRLPVFNNERVMSLGDIAIYTTTDEKPIGEVFEAIKSKFGGAKVDVKSLEKDGGLRTVFAEILPDFDDERVKTSDIKKVFAWYNTLLDGGFDKFVDDEADKQAEETSTEESKVTD